MTRRKKRLVLALALTAAAGGAFSGALALSPSFRGLVLPWREQVWQRFFHRGRLADKRFYRDDGGVPVSFASGALTLGAGLYAPEGAAKRPGIVLLPASTALGRRLAFQRVLARALADRGYAVLSVDVAGFGDSDDPSDLEDERQLDGITDALAAIDFLASRPEADASRLAVAGHSLGGSIALHAAARDSRVRAVVAIGPGRNVAEKIRHEERHVARFSADRGLSGRVPFHVLRGILLRHDVSAAVPLYSAPGHVPLLLAEGSLENAAERAAMRDAFDAMAEPKRLVTLDGADHYGNADALTRDGSFGFYDRGAMGALVAAIEETLATVFGRAE